MAKVQNVVVGQDRVVASLTSALTTDRLAHGLLFVGPDGVGREHTARSLARGLLCELRGTPTEVRPFGCGECRACRRAMSGSHPDLHVIMSEAELVARGLEKPDGKARPSPEIKIDAVRDLGQKLLQRPYEAQSRVAIVVDAHKMNEKAQNALLKALEEPAPTTILILLVPGVRAVLPTISSRCLRLAFAPLGEDALRTILHRLEIPDADARAARAQLGLSSVPAVLDDGDGVVGEGVDRLLFGLAQRLRPDSLGERLELAASLGRDRLELDQLLVAAMRKLAAGLRERGGVDSQDTATSASAVDDVAMLDGLLKARRDLQGNGAAQLVLERLLLANPPDVLSEHRR